ncbi:ParA family protein [Nocardia sp. NPDC127579]|uniref:ParA family protein n=1 Tax=Nocardia sp. NPDC127579 TaxID=3345402 RepID=UPI0036270F42
MWIYAIANQKGGVGKTVDTINLGAALAEAGRRVLVIDWDPQGNLSDALGVEPAPAGGANLARLLSGEWSGELGELVVETTSGLFVIPTSDDMFLLEPKMYAMRAKEEILSRFLDKLEGVFDDVLIDSPPSLGALNDNALNAARRRRPEAGIQGRVLVPVQAEDSSIKALALFLRQSSTLQDALGIELDIAGLIINMYDGRKGRIATTTHDAFQTHPLGVLAVFKDSSVIREAWRLRITVFQHAPRSKSAEAFRALAQRVQPELVAVAS